MQNRKRFTASFRRIFRNGSNKQENEFFARWFTQLDLSEGKIFRDQTEESEIEKKMEQNFHDHFFHGGGKTKIIHFPSWLPAAAAAILIIAAGTLFFIPRSKTDHATVFSESFTTTAQRKIVTLPDGSKIILNNSSKIKYPQVFADSLREVFLDGEAFFEIIHDKKKPFMVRTGNLNIQVLGTSFNVRHYKSDKTIDVVVATGKVGVNAKACNDVWMLTPRNRLVYNSSTGKAVESIVNPSDYTGWQNGELIFKNEKLADICKRLERWYGVTISINTASLKSKRISLKQHDESLYTVLKMLGITAGFNYEIKNKDVRIW